MMLHDFNGKKAKILHTLKQIDDIRSGYVKLVVFQNLLSCLEVEVEPELLDGLYKKVGMTYEGLPYIKYEAVLR